MATARLRALETVARAAAAYVRISDARQPFAVWSAARADLRVSLNCLAATERLDEAHEAAEMVAREALRR